MPGKRFTIKINKFYQGFSPLYWKNALSEFGNPGHANAMVDCNLLDPTYITQGFALSDLVNGNQSVVVDQLIRYVLDEGMNGGSHSFGIGSTKLFELNSTTVTSDADFPHAVTSCIEGQSIVAIGDVIYYLFNVSGSGNIGKHTRNTSTFDDDWGSTVPVGAATLQQDFHPAFAKEDMFLFGNGRYAGVYTLDDDTIDVDKLDFGAGAQVADVIFHSNQWMIAVNQPALGNINSAQVFLYDASGVSNLLSDELSLTIKRIGWIKAVNGIVFITYSDTNGAWLGYVSGRSIKPLKALPSLPAFYQKSIYQGSLIFVANSLIFSGGSLSNELPFQLSQIGDQGYATVGALASPFGTPMVASETSPGFRLAKASGFSVDATWTSLVFSLLDGDSLGVIDRIVVLTKTLAANARCDLYVKSNQESDTSAVMTVTGTGKRRHVFKKTILDLEDFRIYLSWLNGNGTNDCAIREIHVMGHYKEK